MSWPAVAALAMGDADIVMMGSETGKYIHQLSGQNNVHSSCRDTDV